VSSAESSIPFWALNGPERVAAMSAREGGTDMPHRRVEVSV
jgi:hypothetical protein